MSSAGVRRPCQGGSYIEAMLAAMPAAVPAAATRGGGSIGVVFGADLFNEVDHHRATAAAVAATYGPPLGHHQPPGPWLTRPMRPSPRSRSSPTLSAS